MRYVLFLAFVTATTAAAQTGASMATQQPAAQPSGDEQALIKLDRELSEARRRGDRSLFERTALPGYVFLNPGGFLEEGTQRPPGPPDKIQSHVLEDVRVRLHGETAVLTGRVTVKGLLGSGRDISGQYRYMRVFVRQSGQ